MSCIADSTAWWWLRSPGDAECAACVYSRGYADVYGRYVRDVNGGIRPALKIYLSSPYVNTGEKVKVSAKGSEWDTVTFGKYDGMDIRWRVLNVTGDDAFLVSDKILTNKAYNDKSKSITWKDSTIRTWLNGEFLTESFGTAEQQMIQKTLVKNEDNIYYGTEGGEDTEDKVFLLSLNDIIQPGYGFPDQYGISSETRVARNLAGKAGWWWLRLPGGNTNYAANISSSDYAYDGGNCVDDSDIGIRLAVHIDLSSSC